MLNINSLIYLIKTQQSIMLSTFNDTLRYLDREIGELKEEGERVPFQLTSHRSDVLMYKRILQGQIESLEKRIDADLNDLYKEYKATLETNKMELEGGY